MKRLTESLSKKKKKRGVRKGKLKPNGGSDCLESGAEGGGVISEVSSRKEENRGKRRF